MLNEKVPNPESVSVGVRHRGLYYIVWGLWKASSHVHVTSDVANTDFVVDIGQLAAITQAAADAVSSGAQHPMASGLHVRALILASQHYA